MLVFKPAIKGTNRDCIKQYNFSKSAQRLDVIREYFLKKPYLGFSYSFVRQIKAAEVFMLEK